MKDSTFQNIARLFEQDDVTDQEFELWLDFRSKLKHQRTKSEFGSS